MSSFFHRFQWMNSEAHLLLLSKFIQVQNIDGYTKWGNWAQLLDETPQKAIKRFVDEGMLINADLNTIVSCKYKISELKALLKQRKLTMSGTKSELVQKLIYADKEGMTKLVEGLELLVCTQTGREIAEQYKAKEKERRIIVEQKLIGYLEKRMLRKASLLADNYIANQVEMRGLGNWKRPTPEFETEILKSIFNSKPEILSKMEDTNLEPLRIGAAMMELLGTNTASKWLPTNFETGLSLDNDSAARMLVFQASKERALIGYKESRVVQYVEILTADDTHACESCKALKGKRYKVSEAPTLPYPNCTYELGCRCCYIPCVD